MAQKQILIICGEPSGELHAAHLVKALRKTDPDIKISATGAQLLRNEGADVFYDIKELSVMGFFDVFKKLPKFFSLKNLILEKIESEKPDAIIFVDFSGFNLRLAKAINNRIKTIYYVSPQVWASRPGRVKIIKKYIQKMIVLFEFEKVFYEKYGIKAEWVGHPLLDVVKPTMTKEELLKNIKLDNDKPCISLLPGSRKEEIKRILPIMLKSAEIINKSTSVNFIIAKSPQVNWDIYNVIIRKYKIDVKIIEGKPYDCMNIADFCLVCSGTATLETAIMQKPFVIVYKTSLLNYLLYRPLIRVPFIGIVNIVAGERIIPEFIQFNSSPGRIAKETLNYLENRKYLEGMVKRLETINSSLGTPNAATRAAKIIINTL